MLSNKIRIYFSLNEELLSHLDTYCILHDVPRSYVIRFALFDFFNKYGV